MSLGVMLLSAASAASRAGLANARSLSASFFTVAISCPAPTRLSVTDPELNRHRTGLVPRANAADCVEGDRERGRKGEGEGGGGERAFMADKKNS